MTMHHASYKPPISIAENVSTKEIIDLSIDDDENECVRSAPAAYGLGTLGPGGGVLRRVDQSAFDKCLVIQGNSKEVAEEQGKWQSFCHVSLLTFMYSNVA
jgi:hypothetical protein